MHWRALEFAGRAHTQHTQTPLLSFGGVVSNCLVLSACSSAVQFTCPSGLGVAGSGCQTRGVRSFCRLPGGFGLQLATGLAPKPLTCSEARSGTLLGVLARWARLARSAVPESSTSSGEFRPRRQAGRSLDNRRTRGRSPRVLSGCSSTPCGC